MTTELLGRARLTNTTNLQIIGVAHIVLPIPTPSDASQRYLVEVQNRVSTPPVEPRLFLASRTPLTSRK